MIESLSKPVRQLLAVGLVVIVLALLTTIVIIPVAEHFAGVRERIATERETLGRLSAAVARASEVRQNGRNPAAESGAFLKGESEAIQLAELQALLKDIAASQGIRLLSLRTLPSLDRDGVHFVGVRADLNGSVADVQKLLHKLESSRPLLILDFVQLEPISAARADASKGDTLVVGFNAYGAVLRRKG